jgi:hypothetical protein
LLAASPGAGAGRTNPNRTGFARQEFETARFQSERLLSQLRLAELCVLANKPALAKPFVEELVATVEALHLREWEPAESNVCAWRAARDAVVN